MGYGLGVRVMVEYKITTAWGNKNKNYIVSSEKFVRVRFETDHYGGH